MPRAHRWTPEGLAARQASARETVRRCKPWLKSTGPRTKEGKAVTRQNAIKWGHRIEQPEIVTDPDVALGQLTMALWLFEESPSERRAAVAYTWCQRLVDLGAGDVLNGFPASIVAEVGTS